MSQTYRRTLFDSADEIVPEDAAPILGLSRTATYDLISALQRYVDPTTGLVEPLPDDYSVLRTRKERNAWRRRHRLVIPAWGAESVCNGDWRISRPRVTAWALTDGWRIPALLAAARDTGRDGARKQAAAGPSDEAAV